MTDYSSHTSYSRYFSPRQKVFLINMSEVRDVEEYESLSGIVAECGQDTLEVRVPYFSEQLFTPGGPEFLTFKITTESMGVGLQITAELSCVKPGNIFCFKLKGLLETYQRRQTPRVDTTIKIYRISQEYSLAVYRKEYRRIITYRKNHGAVPNLKLVETDVNISAGGIGLSVGLKDTLSTLSMFFFDLEDGQPPVCALAEIVWSRKEEASQRCGHRFIQIMKSDQQRLGKYVQALRKSQGLPDNSRTNWELLDRMIFQEDTKK